MDYTIYKYSLCTALTLMLFFCIYFFVAKTPEKAIFSNYIRSRRIMGMALLVLSANYSVHLFDGLRFYNHDAAILMNLSTYFLSYWLFSAAFITLLDRFYLTTRRFAFHIGCWLAFSFLSCSIILFLPKGAIQHIAMVGMAVWLVTYGIYMAHKIISTYHRAVHLFDDTHSEDIGAYIRWMSILTWWAVIYGVSCGLWTFLPNKYIFLWILSSIPFYIYIYCSYINYLLFYEQVETILEQATPEEQENTTPDIETTDNETPAYYTSLEKKLSEWLDNNGYTTPGLNIEELSVTLGTNRTYLSVYINSVYHVSFREWIACHRIEYAKKTLAANPQMTVAEASETAGFLSLSYFTKIFSEKEGISPSKWRKKLLSEPAS